mmetsp:Transcript_4008/g.8025  ORF Transcript_4008/g.8025 Transcript_4008/m.8025 type:complete len:81 (+) Transcript_4008:864-1106(+)
MKVDVAPFLKGDSSPSQSTPMGSVCGRGVCLSLSSSAKTLACFSKIGLFLGEMVLIGLVGRNNLIKDAGDAMVQVPNHTS